MVAAAAREEAVVALVEEAARWAAWEVELAGMACVKKMHTMGPSCWSCQSAHIMHSVDETSHSSHCMVTKLVNIYAKVGQTISCMVGMLSPDARNQFDSSSSAYGNIVHLVDPFHSSINKEHTAMFEGCCAKES